METRKDFLAKDKPDAKKNFSLNAIHDEPPPLPKQPPPPIKSERSSGQDEYANDFLMEMKKRLKSVHKSQEDIRYEDPGKNASKIKPQDIIVSREIKGMAIDFAFHSQIMLK